MDPPEHTKHRGMVEFAFTQEHVDSLKPLIQKTVDDLLDKMVQKASGEAASGSNGRPAVDLVEEFALPVPSYVRFPFTHPPHPPFFFLIKTEWCETN